MQCNRGARSGSIAMLALVLTVGCAATGTSASDRAETARPPAHSPSPHIVATPSPVGTDSPGPSPTASASRTAQPAAVAPPAWLGTRVLPRTSTGFARALTTPPELRDRRFTTVDRLPPPTGTAFAASVTPVSPAVAARSTWSSQCPVALADLRYLTVSFWGFDQRPHTGEMIVNADVAHDVVTVFADLYRDHFPIEDMRVASVQDLDAPPTGDGNTTSAFACRPTRGSTSWSQHAYGRAVDVNPFQNPYSSGGVVLPELASAYLDRGWKRPGMIFAGDEVTRAFAAVGWQWGGSWHSPKDRMHFSANGH